MNPDFEVDTTGLRSDAATLAGTAARVTGAADSAPLPDPTPRWSTTGAAELAATAARQLLTQLGADIEATARQIRATAEAYEEADTRAAKRLRLSR
ncbi:type VII secretion target [Actinoplanes sp. NBC_00393]|uniref:type VII secretion target n=1 Tax=Actinoplanes sp. NBC_00393 TaxID=2975953 RepID=UPI002E248AD9